MCSGQLHTQWNGHEPTATPERLGVKAGTAHGPCTQHHQEVGRPPKLLFLPNLQTPPVVTTGKEPARPSSGSEQGTCRLFLRLCAAAPSQVLCEFLIWPLINFLIKESKDPVGNSFSGRPLSLSCGWSPSPCVFRCWSLWACASLLFPCVTKFHFLRRIPIKLD